MIVGKSLQTGNVGGEREFAVAHAERRQRIGFFQDHTMPGHQYTAVDKMNR